MIEALLLAAAALQATGAPPRPATPDIVVVARPLADSEAALRACLQRHCPPDEDIKATLAHAENQFVAGDYQDARGTVRDSLGRNKRFTKDYPILVSSLWRADSRLAIHLSEADGYRVSAIASLDALRAGMDKDDPRVFAQRIEVADSFAHLGRADGATTMYKAIAHDAERAGRTNIQGFALLKAALLECVISEHNPTYRSTARQAIRALLVTTDPKLAPFREAAGAVASTFKLHGSTPDPEYEQLAAAYRSHPTARPQLIFAPPIKSKGRDSREDNPDTASGSTTARMLTDPVVGQWADVCFWIAADGHVTDASVLRQSKTFQDYWIKPVLASITGRKYAPLATDPAGPGVLRVERYTQTAYFEDSTTGTHLRSRGSKCLT